MKFNAQHTEFMGFQDLLRSYVSEKSDYQWQVDPLHSNCNQGWKTDQCGWVGWGRSRYTRKPFQRNCIFSSGYPGSGHNKVWAWAVGIEAPGRIQPHTDNAFTCIYRADKLLQGKLAISNWSGGLVACDVPHYKWKSQSNIMLQRMRKTHLPEQSRMQIVLQHGLPGST